MPPTLRVKSSPFAGRRIPYRTKAAEPAPEPVPPQTEKQSYFAVCERDEGGQCLPKGVSGAPTQQKETAPTQSQETQPPAPAEPDEASLSAKVESTKKASDEAVANLLKQVNKHRMKEPLDVRSPQGKRKLSDFSFYLSGIEEDVQKGKQYAPGFAREVADAARELADYEPHLSEQFNKIADLAKEAYESGIAYNRSKSARTEYLDNRERQTAHAQRLQDSSEYRAALEDYENNELPTAKREFEKSDEVMEYRKAKVEHDEWEKEHAVWEESSGAGQEKYGEDHSAWEERDGDRQSRRIAIDDMRGRNLADDAMEEAKEQEGVPESDKAVVDASMSLDTAEQRTAHAEAVANNLEVMDTAWDAAYGPEGSLIQTLKEAGATDKDITPYLRMGEKGGALLKKKGEAWQKAVLKYHAHMEVLEKHSAEEPEEVDEPDEPESDRDAAQEKLAAWEEAKKQHDAWEKEAPPEPPQDHEDTPEAEAAYDQAWAEYDAYQEREPELPDEPEDVEQEWADYKADLAAYKKRQAWEAKQEKLEEQDEKLSNAADEAMQAFDGVWDMAASMDEKLEDLPDKLEERLAEEEETDPEPEEFDEDEPEEPDLPDEPEFEPPDPPDPRDYEPDEVEEEEPEEEEDTTKSMKTIAYRVKASPFLNRKALGEEHRSTQTDLPGYRGLPDLEEIEELHTASKRQYKKALSLSSMPAGLIDLPDVRQADDYSCWAAICASVGKYFGVGPKSLTEWKKKLHTTEEFSTDFHAAANYLQSLGLRVEMKTGLTLADLEAYWHKGMPVLCAVKDYGARMSKKEQFNYGHGLAFIGGPAFGYCYFQDPSEDNIIQGEESIQAPGRIMVAVDDFLKVWYDEDREGNEYVHLGIAVGPGGQLGKKALPPGDDKLTQGSIASQATPPAVTGAPEGAQVFSDADKKRKVKPSPFLSRWHKAFTGSEMDSAGRKRCYSGGKPISCGSQPSSSSTSSPDVQNASVASKLPDQAPQPATNSVSPPTALPGVPEGSSGGKPKVKPSPFLARWHKGIKSGSHEGEPCQQGWTTRTGCIPAEEKPAGQQTQQTTEPPKTTVPQPPAVNFKAATPADFIKARSQSTRTAFLSAHTEVELKGKKLFLSDDGKVGYMIDEKGDFGNLFNNKGPKGAGQAAILHAIEQGALTLDCFQGYLSDLYAKYGYKPTGAVKFNDEYAPEGWDYEKSGRPDVIFMAFTGGDRATLRERVGSFPEFAHPGAYYDDYDSGKADSRRVAVDAEAHSGLRGGVDYGKLEDAGRATGLHPKSLIPFHLHKSLNGHSYGCLMANPIGDIPMEIREWAKDNILPHHVAKGGIVGKDFEPHLTLLYGFTEDSKKQRQAIKALLTAYGPIHARLKNLNLFRGGEDGDVLHVQVDSADCKELNRLLRDSFPHVSTHPRYHCHLTIAYLDPNFAPTYTAMKPTFLNRDVVIKEVEWSGVDDKREIIYLTQGKKSCPSCGHKSIQSNGEAEWCAAAPCEWSRTKALNPETDEPYQQAIAVDFDGRVVEVRRDRDLSKTVLREGAREALQKFHNAGLRVIIWTARDDLEDVAAYLRKQGVYFDNINENPDQPTDSKKVMASIYLDDRGEGGVDTPWPELVDLVFTRLGLHKQPVQQGDGYKELRTKAEAAIPEFEELLGGLGMPSVEFDTLNESLDDMPGPFVVMGPIKDEQRATDKVYADYNGDWSRLFDVIRASVSADTMEELWAAVDKLKDSGATYARPIKDRFAEPTPVGYSDVLANYKLPSGVIAEVQFHLRQMLAAREADRENYTLLREAGADNPARDRAWEHSQQLFGEAQKAVRGNGLVHWCAEKPCDYRKEELNITRTKAGDFRNKPCPPGHTAKREGCIPKGRLTVVPPTVPITPPPEQAKEPVPEESDKAGPSFSPDYFADDYARGEYKHYQELYDEAQLSVDNEANYIRKKWGVEPKDLLWFEVDVRPQDYASPNLSVEGSWQEDEEGGEDHFQELVDYLSDLEGVQFDEADLADIDRSKPDAVKKLLRNFDYDVLKDDDWNSTWGPYDWQPGGEWGRLRGIALRSNMLGGERYPVTLLADGTRTDGAHRLAISVANNERSFPALVGVPPQWVEQRSKKGLQITVKALADKLRAGAVPKPGALDKIPVHQQKKLATVLSKGDISRLHPLAKSWLVKEITGDLRGKPCADHPGATARNTGCEPAKEGEGKPGATPTASEHKEKLDALMWLLLKRAPIDLKELDALPPDVKKELISRMLDGDLDDFSSEVRDWLSSTVAKAVKEKEETKEPTVSTAIASLEALPEATKEEMATRLSMTDMSAASNELRAWVDKYSKKEPVPEEPLLDKLVRESLEGTVPIGDLEDLEPDDKDALIELLEKEDIDDIDYDVRRWLRREKEKRKPRTTPWTPQPLGYEAKTCLQNVFDYALQNQAEALYDVAEANGISEDEVKEALHEAFQKADLTINFDPNRDVRTDDDMGYISVIDSLLEEPRLKNLFETNNGGGSTNKAERSSWEESNFGEEVRDVPSQHRPKYGAVNWNRSPRGAVTDYGNCYFALKKSKVMDHTTLTPDNSSSTSNDQVAPLANFYNAAARNRYALKAAGLQTGTLSVYGYNEIQVWGDLPISPDTVEAIYIPEWMETERIGKKLKELSQKTGVPLKVQSKSDDDEDD